MGLYIYIYIFNFLFHSFNFYLFISVFECSLHLTCHTPTPWVILGVQIPFLIPPGPSDCRFPGFLWHRNPHFSQPPAGISWEFVTWWGPGLQLPRGCKLIFVWQERSSLSLSDLSPPLGQEQLWKWGGERDFWGQSWWIPGFVCRDGTGGAEENSLWARERLKFQRIMELWDFP